jgi:hypothetical protein
VILADAVVAYSRPLTLINANELIGPRARLCR